MEGTVKTLATLWQESFMKFLGLVPTLLVCSLLSGVPAFAAAQNTPLVSKTKTEAPKSLFQSFKVGQDVELEILQLGEGPAQQPLNKTLSLKKATDITILEIDNDPYYGDVVRIGVDSDNESAQADVWVRVNDLVRANLEPADINTNSEDPVLTEQDIDGGSILSEADLFSAKKLRKKRMTYCYRFVKQMLLKKKMVPVYLPGGSAWMASVYLPKYGFKKTGHNGHTAQLNEVCVYRGGKGGNGHIEIKLPSGWWYGYGYHGPITDRLAANHKLVGCYKK
jgi:hypothetical protein